MENLLPKSLQGTPRRTVIVGIVAIVLATILLLVYLNHYRNSVKSSNADVAVLVSKSFIPKGTTALAAANGGLWQYTSIPKDQVKDGAVTDAAILHGQVALSDIFPSQQLLTTDFGASATSSSLSGSPDLTGTGISKGRWRAMSFPLDSSHGIVPQVQTNDRVDVYAIYNGVTWLLMQNVLVLAAPNQTATNTTAPTSENYILRIPNPLVAKYAFLADNGKLWFALRPQKGAKPAQPAVVTGSNVLTGR
jgi:pilus assembly protein CpaB